MTLLRNISFSLDYYWKITHKKQRVGKYFWQGVHHSAQRPKQLYDKKLRRAIIRMSIQLLKRVPWMRRATIWSIILHTSHILHSILQDQSSPTIPLLIRYSELYSANGWSILTQVYKPQKAVTISQALLMLGQVCLYFVTFEIWQHYWWVVVDLQGTKQSSYQYALSYHREWKHDHFTSMDAILTSGGALLFMWMKFLIIWRFVIHDVRLQSH